MMQKANTRVIGATRSVDELSLDFLGLCVYARQKLLVYLRKNNNSRTSLSEWWRVQNSYVDWGEISFQVTLQAEKHLCLYFIVYQCLRCH